MKAIALISVLLALFALIFPIALSVSHPIDVASPSNTAGIAEQPDNDSGLQDNLSASDASTTIRLKRGNAVTEITMDEYLYGVVGAEMPAAFETEALKAQAVAARTYTLYKMQVNPSENHPDADVCDDSNCCKAYKDDNELKEKWGTSYSAYAEKIKYAVSSTDGEYLAYDNEPILAVFHSSSTGKTENAENVWGTALPYLVSVDSKEDTDSVPQYESIVTVSKSNFQDAIKASHTDAEFGDDDSTWINNTEYSDSGRLLSADIGGVTITGTELRKLFDLRSTGMEINITDDDVVFAVTGYGHGVGMSQYGANTMAQNGSTYDKILTWYYTDAVLTHTD